MQLGNQVIADKFINRLKACLEQANSDAVRISCLEELADMQDIPSLNVVEKVLLKTLREDANAVVRHEAAFVLGRLYRLRQSISEEVLSALCESARTDPSIIVRHEATEVLGKVRDPRIPTVLRELAEDSNVDVAVTARLSLEHQGQGAEVSAFE